MPAPLTLICEFSILFDDDRSAALHSALRDGRVPRPNAIRLDEAYLSTFGELYVPRTLWRTMQRFDAWIEPALIAEWSRLMKRYASSQDRALNESTIANAMTWSDPKRDVRIAKEQALRLIEKSTLHCVWTGRVLSPQNLDVDHCFPWAAWPCEDLWNLLPTDRTVNQN